MNPDPQTALPGVDPIGSAFPREALPEGFVARTMVRVRATPRPRAAVPPPRGFAVDALVALAAAVAVVSSLWGATRGVPPLEVWTLAGDARGATAAWLVAALAFAAGAGAMALAAWLAGGGTAGSAPGRRARS